MSCVATALCVVANAPYNGAATANAVTPRCDGILFGLSPRIEPYPHLAFFGPASGVPTRKRKICGSEESPRHNLTKNTSCDRPTAEENRPSAEASASFARFSAFVTASPAAPPVPVAGMA